jgi:hypothetical protein
VYPTARHKKFNLCIFCYVFVTLSQCTDSTVIKDRRNYSFTIFSLDFCRFIFTIFLSIKLTSEPNLVMLLRISPVQSNALVQCCACIYAIHHLFFPSPFSYLNFKKKIRIFLSFRMDSSRAKCDLFYIYVLLLFSQSVSRVSES